MPAIRTTFHRVTSKTKPPYLARVNGFGKRTKQPMIIFVKDVVIDDSYGPVFARSIILSSPSNYPDLTAGNTMIVTNFRSLSRMELAGVPHSDSDRLRSSAEKASDPQPPQKTPGSYKCSECAYRGSSVADVLIHKTRAHRS